MSISRATEAVTLLEGPRTIVGGPEMCASSSYADLTKQTTITSALSFPEG